MRKGFLRYKEMRKYFPIYEEAVSHILYDFATAPFWISLYSIWGKFDFLFYQCRDPKEATIAIESFNNELQDGQFFLIVFYMSRSTNCLINLSCSMWKIKSNFFSSLGIGKSYNVETEVLGNSLGN